MDNMVEIGIPVYKAKDTLPQTLDSLICQTKQNFIVCLSIDCDNEDYTEIINTYKNRGLKIRVINGEENGGPGIARQRVIDSTICDYLMFVDSDDILMPRAVEILYTNAKLHDYDIMQGSFIKEFKTGEDKTFIASTSNLITWFHAKIYKVKFLKDKNIRFLPDLRADEDSHFNAVAWNSTTNKGFTDEILYLWRNNPNSITRNLDPTEYFKKTYYGYIYGQVEALKKIFYNNNSITSLLVTNTLINIYYYYMKARFYRLDESKMDNILSTFKKEKWMQVWLGTGENWIDIVNNIKAGQVYENNQYVVFFEETFNRWANRLLKED